MSNKQQINFQRLRSRGIPKGWDLVKLGNEKIALKLRSGGTPLTSNKKYWENGDISFVKIEDITNSKKFLYKTKNKITKLGLENSSAWLVPPNSLLLSMYASFGEVIINKIPVATNQAILGICINEKNTNLDYIFYQLQNSKRDWLENIQENTQKNLNAEISKNFPILFPSLKEQQKIASIISNVDELIQKTEQIIEQSQRLKKGLMQRLLTKGIGHTKFKKTEFGDIPFDWEIVNLEKISSKFISGGTPSTSNISYWDGNIPWIRSAWITGKYVSSGERYIAKLGLENSSAKLIPKDNVIVATRVSLGNVTINKIDVAINQDLTGIIVDKSKIKSEYLYWILLKESERISFLSQGSTIRGITREDLISFKIPLPPLQEQQKIASILSNVDELIQKIDQIIKQTQRLKKGLMQQLLTGKIRVTV